MKTRAITGFFFVIVMLASVLLADYVKGIFDLFYLVLSILCLNEFYSLVTKSGVAVNRFLGLLNGILVFCTFWITIQDDGDPSNKYVLLVLVPSVISIFFYELFKKTESPFTNIAYTILGLVLIVIPFSFFTALAHMSIYTGPDYHYPLAFLIMLWCNDTGAYLCGMGFGRHKLFERHSPKKTWEGFIGGVLIAAGVGVIIGQFFHEISCLQWAIMGAIIGIVGTMGDLVESMFKRSINVKDSGGILPGHGGLLDRFDGLFFAVPVVYAYLYLIIN